ncbi:hypothetical protein CKY05_06380 [Photorhabdus sp. S10-54]|nr:hypothetical protein CKY05_06380 [Photorhabdus sp. S10-54]RAX02196.1 hypothetical protein CKY03_04445 [Photorhabdus sp. S9-53]
MLPTLRFFPTIEATEALPPIAPPIPADSTASLVISAPFSQAGNELYNSPKSFWFSVVTNWLRWLEFLILTLH